MINVTSIDSLTNFQKNAKKFVQKLSKSKEPLVLTVNGKASVVVQNAEAYQDLWDLAETARFAAALKEGLDDIAAGRVHPAEEVFAEIEAEYGI